MNSTTAPQTFATRHYHVYDWHSRVVFACVSATIIDAGKMRGGIREVKSAREQCEMRRKLES